MTDSLLQSHAERELQYQLRKHVSQEIRKRCPDSDPMTTGVIVMLGSVLAMAAFSAILGRNGSKHYR
jgi:hypothetical protein